MRGTDTDGSAMAKIEDVCTIVDTLKMARTMHPGQKNSLDALCKRYEIDNSQRTLHGALLDAEILADVYLTMTGGQVALTFDVAGNAGPGETANRRSLAADRPPLPVIRASEAEREAHEARLEAIDAQAADGCLWLQLQAQADAEADTG